MFVITKFYMATVIEIQRETIRIECQPMPIPFKFMINTQRRNRGRGRDIVPASINVFASVVRNKPYSVLLKSCLWSLYLTAHAHASGGRYSVHSTLPGQFIQLCMYDPTDGPREEHK